MKDVIETLSSIDASASQIMENAAAQKANLSREFDDKARDMRERTRKETADRLKELTAQLDAQNEEELRRLGEEARKNLAALDENYSNNHDQYVREIFSHITGA